MTSEDLASLIELIPVHPASYNTHKGGRERERETEIEIEIERDRERDRERERQREIER